MREAQLSTLAQNILSHGCFRVFGLSYAEGIRKDSPTSCCRSVDFLWAGHLGSVAISTCKNTANTEPAESKDSAAALH